MILTRAQILHRIQSLEKGRHHGSLIIFYSEGKIVNAEEVTKIKVVEEHNPRK